MALAHIAIRGVLVAVFAISGGEKLREVNRQSLSAAVAGVSRAFERAADGVAWLIVCAELITAMLLAVSGGTLAFAFATALLTVFTGAVMTVVARGQKVRCACFGADGTELGRSHVLRNGLLLSSVIAGLSTLSAHAPSVAQGLIVGFSGAVLGACLTRWDDIAYLAARRSSELVRGG